MTTAGLSIDVLVLVPKRDELWATAAVFGFDPDTPDGRSDDDREYWRAVAADLTVGVLLIDRQGNTDASLTTDRALGQFDPALVMLVGTAAGRQDKASYLEVVIPLTVVDGSEWHAEEGGLQPRWDAGALRPPDAARYDIERFVRGGNWRPRCRELFEQAVRDLYASASSGAPDVPDQWPVVSDGWGIATSFLHEDPALLSRVWAIHDRLRVVDMESAGFAKACAGQPRIRPWFVVRAVSDFGTRGSKRDGLRPAAAAAAACVARTFLEIGLVRTHPLLIRPPETGESNLSARNFFAQKSMSDFLAEQLPGEFGVTLDPTRLSSGLSSADLAALCAGCGRTPDEIADRLDALRATYFTDKYLDYEDEGDLRQFIGDAWADEVRRCYEFLRIGVAQSDVMYVGVGSGRDLEVVVPAFRSLIGVDVSPPMLEQAVKRQPRLECWPRTAERLAGIDDGTVDLYLSLRTYQSSLFDIPAALREATRVLRPGGGIVLSVAGGYVDEAADGTVRLVPGLLIPGSTVVDPSGPRQIAWRVLAGLESLAYEGIAFHQGATDLYIYATRSGGLASMTMGSRRRAN